MKHVTIRLETEIHAALRIRAAELGESISAVAARAVEAYLDPEGEILDEEIDPALVRRAIDRAQAETGG